MGQPIVAEAAAAPPAVPGTLPIEGLERLWAESRGDPDVAVAVLDGPVDLSHPCFERARLEVLEPDGRTDGDRGLAALHGTHVASLLFGGPGGPVPGIAPECRGLIVPVFRTDPRGAVVPCSQLDLARAIVRAVNHGARIINISGGQLETTGEPEPALRDALRLCAAEDVLIVAAAGNDGCECLHLPAADPSVLVVGAMDAGGEPLALSNWPESYRDRGLLAPGEAIVGAAPGGGTIALAGTSFAAAIVSGVAALLMSIQRQRGQRVSAHAVRQALLDGAVGCDESPTADCRRLLAGRLSVERALAHIISPTHVTTEAETAMAEHIDSSAQSPVRSSNRLGSYLENGGGDAPAWGGHLPPAVAPVVERGVLPPAAFSAPTSDAAPAPKTAGCSCGAKTRTLVYALGQIDYDFGTEANRDSFLQQGLENPADPQALLAHLDASPWAAESVIWVLVQETTPIYGVRPAGPFALAAYDRLREFLRGQLADDVSHVSIPGVESGEVTLLNGQTVPVVAPDVRGMYSWSTPALVKAVLGPRPRANGKHADYDRQRGEIGNFLDRVYYELSNLGLSPRDRAINYAATNAFQAAVVYQRALKDCMRLDAITAERSRVCRPGADCWDVKLTFFDPCHRHERARVVHRFTVDVSEAIPVTVGPVRSWEIY
ncbi:MAG TPA: PatA/PatG family cyanobactin maturation protease [Planctomycetaceae bacterium]|nr:PatA/PatG family cyanobactin maturation protease [Planctomycetaceae bacterium]